ncbi:MAG: ATP-binding protein [Thermodesulfovibrionales bacterium]
MKDMAVIRVQSHPRYLSVVRAVTGRMSELCGMSDTAIEDVRLAVDEACSNVIKHAYGGDTGKSITVRFRHSQREFEVIIEDTGLKADPELIVGRSLDEVRPGGLGIHLIRRAFDTFTFDEKKKRGNRLRLVRHLE